MTVPTDGCGGRRGRRRRPTELLVLALAALLHLQLVHPALARALAAPASGDDPTQVVRGLLERRLPEPHVDLFELALTAPSPSAAGADMYTLSPSSTIAGGIRVAGNSPVSLSAGVGYYLAHVANASISWSATGGDNIAAALPPASLPPLPGNAPITRCAHGSALRYYFNTCTYGYSMVWWDWVRWERELDWMALHGVNAPLSMLGTEWAWRETFTGKAVGLARADLDDFFSGPAFLPWHWMGNLDAWGGPLSDAWIERGRALQHQFLGRAREFGMRPILPSFAGFVPKAAQRLFPGDFRTAGGWNGFPATHYVEPVSTAFATIGTEFVRVLCTEFGCVNGTTTRGAATARATGWEAGRPLFAADLYNELSPPSSDLGYLSNTSRAVHATIQAGYTAAVGEGAATAAAAAATTKGLSGRARAAAAKAGQQQATDSGDAATDAAVLLNVTWVTQGWMFHNDPEFWQPAQMRAFLDGVPDRARDLLVLDLYAEVAPVWNRSDAFFGHPWVFSTIFNFGGRSGLYGRLAQVQEGVLAALAANASAAAGASLMVGLGAAPEAIETDPIMYDFLFDLAWTTTVNSNGSSTSTSTSTTDNTDNTDSAAATMAAAPATVATTATVAEALDVPTWVRGWAARRYATHGEVVPDFALDAWETMLAVGPYGCQRPQQGAVGSLVAARPNLAIPKVSCCDETDLYYDPAVLVQVWASLVHNSSGSGGGGGGDGRAGVTSAALSLATKPTFLHDVADVGTQVLSNLALELHADAVAAYHAENATQLATAAAQFLEVVKDVDALAATQDQRLLGQWIAAARATASNGSSSSGDGVRLAASFPSAKCDRQTVAPTERLNCGFPGIGQQLCEAQGCCYDAHFGDFPACFFGVLASEADEMERNARTLVTLWGPEQSSLHEYSYRLWGGLVEAFYLPRWQRWFDAVKAALAAGKPFDQAAFNVDVEVFEQTWCNNATAHEFPTQPTDADQVLALAGAILARHFPQHAPSGVADQPK